jgi:hypothetical protein
VNSSKDDPETNSKDDPENDPCSICSRPRHMHRDSSDHSFEISGVSAAAFAASSASRYKAGETVWHNRELLVKMDNTGAISLASIAAMQEHTVKHDGKPIVGTLVYLIGREAAIVVEKPLDEVLALIERAMTV